MREIFNRKPQVILLGNGLNLAFGDSVCGAEVIHCNELKGPDILSHNKYRNYCDAALMDIGERIEANRKTAL